MNPTVDFPIARRSSLIYKSVRGYKVGDGITPTKFMMDEKIGVPKKR